MKFKTKDDEKVKRIVERLKKEDQEPVVEGNYCAYVTKDCLIKEKYNKLKGGMAVFKGIIERTLEINNWKQYKKYLIERIDNLIMDCQFGTREFYWGMNINKKEVVYKCGLCGSYEVIETEKSK